MSVQYDAPLTPPLTENDAQHQSTSTKASASASSSAASSYGATVYQNVFQSLADFAMQDRLPALVDLALAADLNVDSESRLDQSRLLLVAPLVLSYITLDELSSARIAMSRLPAILAEHTLSRALFKLLDSVQIRLHPAIYKNAGDLTALVQQPNFFDKSLAAVIKLMTEQFISTFRHKMMELIARAYTSISISMVQPYLNLPEEDVRRAAKNYGWTYDSETRIINPSSSTMPATSSFGSSVSSLSTVGLLVNGAAQLETST
ncbi:hypothetical protein M0805_002135 [Coniferiporia weirii]|nr:hypothetical protein M0805_002135 [Coniferiporia weirii]